MPSESFLGYKSKLFEHFRTDERSKSRKCQFHPTIRMQKPSTVPPTPMLFIFLYKTRSFRDNSIGVNKIKNRNFARINVHHSTK